MDIAFLIIFQASIGTIIWNKLSEQIGLLLLGKLFLFNFSNSIYNGNSLYEFSVLTTSSITNWQMLTVGVKK